LLLGNPAKARAKLGWRHTIGLEAMVNEMVAADYALLGGDDSPLEAIALKTIA
jgi:GDPmannose 4,6-dehydratase